MSLNTSIINGTEYSDLKPSPTRRTTTSSSAIDVPATRAARSRRRSRRRRLDPAGLGIDKTKPSAPKDLKAPSHRSSTQVKLTWEASTDNVAVNNYVVRRAGKDIKTLDGDLLSYTDTGAQPGVTNSYRVVARDAAGNVSSESNQAKAKTPNALAPDRLRRADRVPELAGRLLLAGEIGGRGAGRARRARLRDRSIRRVEPGIVERRDRVAGVVAHRR